MEKINNRWHKWVKSKECFSFLFDCAPLVISSLSKLELPEDIWPFSLKYMDEKGRKDVLLEVASELWIFLQEQKLPFAQLEVLVQRGDWKKFEQIILRLFIQYYIEKRRNKSEWHSLYRYVRQILSKMPHIVYVAEKNKTFYACCNDPNLPKMPAYALKQEDYNLWPDPECKKTTQKQYIEKTAHFFWQEAIKRLKQKYLIPIKELVSFLWLKSSKWGNRAQLIRECDMLEEDPLEHANANDPPVELVVSRQKLDKLAQDLVNNWSEKMCIAFYLYYEKEKSLEEIAQRLNYKGASGVNYILKQARDSIRSFTSLWPGLSYPDLDETMFGLFMEKIMAICKKQYCDHNNW